MKTLHLISAAVALILVCLFAGSVFAESAADAKAVATALQYFEENQATYNLTNPSENLRVKRVDLDQLGMRHVRFDQYYQGVRVIGGEMIAHLNPDGTTKRAGGRFVSDLNLNVVPSITAEQATDAALIDLAAPIGEARPKTPELVVFPWQGQNYLCWRLYINSDAKPGRWEYYVDAGNGAIVFHDNRIRFGDTWGYGYGVMGNYYSSIPVYFDEVDSIYQLIDNTRLWSPDRIATYMGTSWLPGNIVEDADNYWNDSEPQRAAVDAHVYTGLIYDWLWQDLFRDGYDNSGSSMTSTVNYGTGPYDYNNAYWNGSQIVIFRPSGSNKSLAGCPDVIAHEWGHAVTEYCSALEYQWESGALDESFSDMMGVTFEWNGQTYDTPDWLMAENMSGTPFRSMSDPHLYQQPDYYGTSDPFWFDVVGCIPDCDPSSPYYNDCCGVHTNSGVGNKWFYLLANGGTHHGITVSGIGLENAMEIVYRANDFYWYGWIDYEDAAEMTVDAADDLDPFGTDGFVKQVRCAWQAVGVMVDDDWDLVADCSDNCPETYNPDQLNSDGDAFGNACDNCPTIFNPGQEDNDGDGRGNACDNCVNAYNPDQQNSDGDTFGNACDNCPYVTNPTQADQDGDGDGDACDNCVAVGNPGQEDQDNDGFGDICDNCPNVYNPDQSVPPEWTGTYGSNGSETSIYATPIHDTTFSSGNQTVTAYLSNSPESRTMTVAQNVSYELYMPPGLCQTYDYVDIRRNSTVIKRLYCGGGVDSWNGSFSVVAGDVVTATVEGNYLGDPNKLPPAKSQFTYYTTTPISSTVTGFAMAGSVSPLTGHENHNVSVYLSNSPQSRTMSTSQTISYELYMPPGLCQTYYYVGITRNSTVIKQLYCDGGIDSWTGSFSVAAGDVVTAAVVGELEPDPAKLPPARSEFNYYDLVPGAADFQVVKTDLCGGELLTATHGTANDDQAKAAQLTSDNGYIVAGYTASSGSDFYVVKFNENGSVAWSRTYSNGTNDRAASIVELKFGGYAILGTTDAGGTVDLLLIKTDASGNEQWRHTYGIPGIEEKAGRVIQTSDGSFVLVGSSGPNTSDWDVYLVKTNDQGAQTWAQRLGASGVNEYGYSVLQNTDGTYIIAGETYAGGNADALLMKATSAGGLSWSSNFGGTSFDAGYDVMRDADGNYVLAGKSASTSLGGLDFYVVKANTTGQLMWLTTFGGTSDDYAASIEPTLDSGYLLGGSTESFGEGYADFYIVKFADPPPAAPTLVSPNNGAYWVTHGSITVTLDWNDVATAEQYEVLLDNNADFGSPISNPKDIIASTWTTPYLGFGTYYWKVRAMNGTGWGAWSESRYFQNIQHTDPNPSCPVLFSYDGRDFRQENVLLTACEKSGYVDVVTDYYHLTGPVNPVQNRVLFQIRELEDEITSLHDIALITVDHSAETKIACGVDGTIKTYKAAGAPLSATDQNDMDRLPEVVASDGILFKATGPGYLIVTFPSPGDGDIGYEMHSVQKPSPCIPTEPDEELKAGLPPEKEAGDLKVEILAADGRWIELPAPPSRDEAADEYLFTNLADNEEVVTLRLSWQNGYTTDAVSQIVPADEEPTVTTWKVGAYDLAYAKPTAETWEGFAGDKPLVLSKGDIFEFSYDVTPSAQGRTRDYIIRAVGRYQPDYAVYTNLMPRQYQLYANYPNPFNPFTTISYDLPEQTHIRLSIYNVLGQLVITLMDGEQDAGHYQVVWDGKDSHDQTVASGIYFYRISTSAFAQSKKMVLLK